MKILRICYEFPEPWDGLTPGPFEISRHQLNLGHNIFYLAGGSSKSKIYNFSKKIKIKRFGKSLPVIGPFFVSLKILIYIVKNNLFESYDIIHGHGHLPLFIHLYLLIFKKYRKKYVLHLHITAKGRSNNLPFNFSLKYLLKYIFEWNFHKISDYLGLVVANKVICCSNSVKNEALKIKNRKFDVVENGVNTDLFKFSKKNKLNNFLYVGAISERKRINLIINFLNKYSTEKKLKINLTLVGNGKLKINKSKNNFFKIKKLGYIEYLNLPKIYKKNDVFILLSSYEGLPKVILEALSSGLEIISTKSFKFNEDHRINWIQPNYKSFKNVLDNKLFKNNFSQDNFDISWSKKVLEINKIYEDCINS